MGMTIDDAIAVLGMIEAHGICIEAKNIAAETMYKYQKIEQIIKDWEDGRFSDAVGCLRVKVVVEDGNDD